jgi:hypothetical protein
MLGGPVHPRVTAVMAIYCNISSMDHRPLYVERLVGFEHGVRRVTVCSGMGSGVIALGYPPPLI